MNNSYSLAIHGGAGTILKSRMSPDMQSQYEKALMQALTAGESVLKEEGKALDAVEKAVEVLENCPLFNAGRGSVFTHDGKHEMDAAIMDGETLNAGAVCGVQSLRNPVLLAREILNDGRHVLLSGKGAEEFARAKGLAFETDLYFYVAQRYEQFQEALAADRVVLDHSDKKPDKFGTVGAVARDAKGNLAAATSTGGMTNKKHGRIGDSPIIGAGTYANNKTCAISCTGHGEFFMRAVVAYDISCLMEYKGLSLEQACEEVVMKKLLLLGGEGGLVAVDKTGNICLPFNSEGMYRACVSSGKKPEILIYK